MCKMEHTSKDSAVIVRHLELDCPKCSNRLMPSGMQCIMCYGSGRCEAVHRTGHTNAIRIEDRHY